MNVFVIFWFEVLEFAVIFVFEEQINEDIDGFFDVCANFTVGVG